MLQRSMLTTLLAFLILFLLLQLQELGLILASCCVLFRSLSDTRIIGLCYSKHKSAKLRYNLWNSCVFLCVLNGGRSEQYQFCGIISKIQYVVGDIYIALKSGQPQSVRTGLENYELCNFTLPVVLPSKTGLRMGGVLTF